MRARSSRSCSPRRSRRGLTKGVKHLSKALKSLRDDLATATGAEDVPPLKIKRLSLVNIGMLAGILLALAIAIPSLEGINWASVQSEFENATWAWALLAFVLYPLVPMAWATALLGCVNKDLPFVPTVLTQLACTFLNLITPNGIGGTALQLDYLHKQGVPVASGGSAMVLSTGVGGAIQMALFLIAAADHRHRGRHQQQQRLLRQHHPDRDRGRRRADRHRALRPEDPGQGRARGEAGRAATSGRCSATRRRRCSSSAATPPGT